ncbi:hypothetical protein PshuTeo1_14910 [Pseudomonas hunanensis]|nr:hypothetical protein PshuTeo1_14910 [Pseudomonas hunanensis]
MARSARQNKLEVAVQPKTEGPEEKGPSDVPFINDPEKPPSPPLNDADAMDAAEAEEDIQGDPESI